MRRKEKNTLIKRMAVALDGVLEPGKPMSKEQIAEIIGLLRECDREMPHLADPTAPRRYPKLIADGKLDLTIEIER